MSKPKTKICYTCKKEKPVTEFYQRHSRGDGDTYYPNCKDCDREASKKRSKDSYTPKAELQSSKDKALPAGYCGVCGKDVVPSTEGGYLCPEHAPDHYAGVIICHVCPLLDRCSVRIRCAAWAVCEIPDNNDIERARKAGVIVSASDKILDRDILIPLQMQFEALANAQVGRENAE